MHQLPLCYMPVHMDRVDPLVNKSLFNTTYPIVKKGHAASSHEQALVHRQVL